MLTADLSSRRTPPLRTFPHPSKHSKRDKKDKKSKSRKKHKSKKQKERKSSSSSSSSSASSAASSAAWGGDGGLVGFIAARPSLRGDLGHIFTMLDGGQKAILGGLQDRTIKNELMGLLDTLG